MAIESIDPASDQPLSAAYLRNRRESLGLTQEEVARRMFISLSLYRKLENGDRPLSMSRLEDWCVAMETPIWLLKNKMLSLVLPKLARVEVGVWPPALREEDIEHLEAIPYPAFYHRIPEYDILAANAAARAAFPWLLPSSPESGRPANVIEKMMTMDEARAALINWDTIVHRLVFGLRVLSPGVVAPERLADIIETCSANPEFERMWTTDMSEDIFNDSLVLVRDPVTGGRIHLTMRSYNAYHPDDCEYQLYMLTPRAASTPSTDPFYTSE